MIVVSQQLKTATPSGQYDAKDLNLNLSSWGIKTATLSGQYIE